MKNTFSSLFKHGLILFFAVAQNSFAQYPIFFNDNTSQTFNNLNLNTGSYQVTPTPEHIEYTGISNITANASVVHQASRSIHFGGRFHAGGFTQGVGNFKAGLKSIDVDVAAYSGVKTGVNEIEIGEYEKLEFGLVINRADILAEIDLFLYGNGVVEPGLQGINPFDPDRISFEVTPTIGSYTVSTLGGDIDIPAQILPTHYGFYYIDYETDVANNTWNVKYTPHPWRFRYACKKQGNYEFRFVLKVPGYGDFNYTKVIKVKVVPSDNKGFLEVGADKKHFRYSKTKTSFFGVGCNLFTTSDICNSSDEWGNCNDGKHYNYDNMDLDEIDRFKSQINLMSSNGANYFRMSLGPEGFDAEQAYDHVHQPKMANGVLFPNTKNLRKYKGLGNYQNNSCYMFEFDKILNLCKNNKTKIHLILTSQNLFHYGLTISDAVGTNAAVRWPSCAYSTNVPGGVVNSPIEFFSNATAKAIFKKKLRYYMARWGYSTEIANFTFTSETDGIGNCEMDVNGNVSCPAPFYIDVSYPTTILDWSNEMAHYLRNTMQTNHMIGNNFTTEFPSHPFEKTLFYSSPVFDFNGYNRYTDYKNTMLLGAETFNTLTTAYNKPLVLTESGQINKQVDIMKNSPVDFHNNMWYTACTGLPTVGLHWEWRNGVFPFPPNITTNYTNHFTAINNFMSNVDFENENYGLNIKNQNSAFLSDDNVFEFFAMTNNYNNGNADKAFGWVHNRSYYWGTLLKDLEYRADDGVHYIVDCPLDDDGDNSVLSDNPDDNTSKSCKDGVQNYSMNYDYIRLINVKATTRFKINWYNTMNNSVITSTHENTLLDNFGIHYLKINIPFASTQYSNYDFAFTMEEDPLFRAANPSDSIQNVQDSIQNSLAIVASDTTKTIETKELIKQTTDKKETKLVEEITPENNEILVYPNPHTNEVSISSLVPIESITIVNTLGEVVFTKQKINSRKITIDTSNLVNVVYILNTLLANGVSKKQQIIKMK